MVKRTKPKVLKRLSCAHLGKFRVFLFFLIATILPSATLTGQQKTKNISIDFKDYTVIHALHEINSLSGDMVVFREEIVTKEKKRITLKRDSITVFKAVKVCLEGTNLTCEQQANGKILVAEKPVKEKQIDIITISGRVVDEKGNPLPGVTVRLAGTTLGTATDADGVYVLNLPESQGTFEFSFVGYKSQKVNFSSETKTLQIVMKEEISDLDEVTVIAYGERNKKELINSISSMKAEDLEEIPSASFENLLQGHMAGVEIHNVAGSPGGGGTRVNIRGYNSLLVTGMNDGSPLYVIDGIPMHSFTSPVTGTNTLAELDPSTIESVEVLKDAASAAIYGSRASNGVILITTKKGKAGKAKFSANMSYSSSILPETPTQISGHGERLWHIQMARNERAAYQDWNTYAYVMPESYEEAYFNYAVYDFFWNSGYPEGYSFYPALRQLQDSLNPFFNNSTNWWKYTFRTGKILNANIQASGGSENFKYLVGLGWYDEKGIMLGSDFKRVNFISNLNANLRKNLSLDARVYMAYTDRSRGKAYTGFGGGAKIEGFTVDPMSNSTLLPGAGSAVEEETLKRLNGSLEKNNSFNIRGSMALNYEISKGLTLSANLATDFTQSQKNAFDPSYLSFENLSVSTGEIAQYLMLQTEELLHYKFDVKKDNHFDILLGFTYSHWVVNSFSGSGQGSPSDDIHYVTDAFESLYYDEWGGVRALQSYRSNSEKKVLVSGFGRLAYNYKQKYLTEFTLRRDGSSVFGKDVRWANFPSLALGWTYSEENFLKNVWWLSYGKIRASWGRSGQQFADPYLALGVLETGSNFMGNVGIRPNALTNSKLTWEETDQYDIGFDLDIFDYRVKLKMDYYYKYSKSLLFDVTLPGNVYFHNSQWQNVMEISNEGVELETLFDIFRDSEVKWRAKFNISRNWNRFEKSYTNMDMGNLVVGRSIFGIYAYKDEGFVQDEKDIPVYADQLGNKQSLYFMYDPSYPVRPGMRKIKDMDMDGMISDEDMYYAASALPIAYGGLVNEIKWKGFDVNLLLTYSLGRKIVNAYMEPSLAFNKRFGTIFSNYLKKTYWQKPGDITDLPLLEAGSINYTGQYTGGLDSQIETVNYLRIKQLTIGYNVPKAIVKKLNLDGIRVFFTGENLWLWSNYSGVDPEVVDPITGIDNGMNYPLARKLTLGLSVNF